jgi:hypothetical protein
VRRPSPLIVGWKLAPSGTPPLRVALRRCVSPVTTSRTKTLRTGSSGRARAAASIGAVDVNATSRPALLIAGVQLWPEAECPPVSVRLMRRTVPSAASCR